MDPGWKRLRGPVTAVAVLPGMLALVGTAVMVWLPPFRSAIWLTHVLELFQWGWIPTAICIVLAGVRMRDHVRWLMADQQQVAPGHTYRAATYLCCQAARSMARWVLVFLAVHALVMLRLAIGIRLAVRDPIVYQYANQHFLLLVVWLFETLLVFGVLLAFLMLAADLFPRPVLASITGLGVVGGLLMDGFTGFLASVVVPICTLGLLARALQNTSIDLIYDEERPLHLVQKPAEVDLFTIPPFHLWTAALRRRREMMGSVPRPWEGIGRDPDKGGD